MQDNKKTVVFERDDPSTLPPRGRPGSEKEAVSIYINRGKLKRAVDVFNKIWKPIRPITASAMLDYLLTLITNEEIGEQFVLYLKRLR